MHVIREDVGNPLHSHRVHGNAVGEAVAFIETGFIEFEAGKKRFLALGDDTSGRSA